MLGPVHITEEGIASDSQSFKLAPQKQMDQRTGGSLANSSSIIKFKKLGLCNSTSDVAGLQYKGLKGI